MVRLAAFVGQEAGHYVLQVLPASLRLCVEIPCLPYMKKAGLKGFSQP